ncbi:MAG: DUF4215 domain-containing protein [Spirochaetia bacterium]|nr:DUF4215 domain-containing protein [Spirochaetia bacterium]
MKKISFYINVFFITILISFINTSCTANSFENNTVPDNSICGNNTIEGSEQCDDGNLESYDGCSKTCINEICGDGIVHLEEECDDGNTTSSDGCSSTCILEPGCGNRVVEATEECDDGNIVSGDGCTSTCLFEAGSSALQNTSWEGPCITNPDGSSEKETMVNINTNSIYSSTMTLYRSTDCTAGTEEIIMRMTAVLTDDGPMQAQDITGEDENGYPVLDGNQTTAVKINLYRGALYMTMPSSNPDADNFIMAMNLYFTACSASGPWIADAEHIISPDCNKLINGDSSESGFDFPPLLFSNYYIDQSVSPNRFYQGTSAYGTDDGLTIENRHQGIRKDKYLTKVTP